MVKKTMAYWNSICPVCNYARKKPDSYLGQRVRQHWEKGCVVHKAYEEIYGPEKTTEKKEK